MNTNPGCNYCKHFIGYELNKRPLCDSEVIIDYMGNRKYVLCYELNKDRNCKHFKKSFLAKLFNRGNT